MTHEVTFTNIFIGSKGSCANYMHHNGAKFDGKVFGKEGAYASEGFGWDLISAMNSKSFNNTQEEIEVGEGAKKGQIKTALKKFLKAQSTSKTVLNALADQFSQQTHT